jgi:hypothetical protein
MVVGHLKDPGLRVLLRRVLPVLKSVLASEHPTVERLQRHRAIAAKGDVGGILVTAASSVLLSELKGSNSTDLGSKLLCQFAGNLVECRSLAHARPEIMAATGRTYGEQCEWTARMRSVLEPEVGPMSKAVLEGDGVVRRRSRLIKRRPVTRERLDEPIGR